MQLEAKQAGYGITMSGSAVSVTNVKLSCSNTNQWLHVRRGSALKHGAAMHLA
jgi:hypothetical protein